MSKQRNWQKGKKLYSKFTKFAILLVDIGWASFYVILPTNDPTNWQRWTHDLFAQPGQKVLGQNSVKSQWWGENRWFTTTQLAQIPNCHIQKTEVSSNSCWRRHRAAAMTQRPAHLKYATGSELPMGSLFPVMLGRSLTGGKALPSQTGACALFFLFQLRASSGGGSRRFPHRRVKHSAPGLELRRPWCRWTLCTHIGGVRTRDPTRSEECDARTQATDGQRRAPAVSPEKATPSFSRHKHKEWTSSAAKVRSGSKEEVCNLGWRLSITIYSSLYCYYIIL